MAMSCAMALMSFVVTTATRLGVGSAEELLYVTFSDGAHLLNT